MSSKQKVIVSVLMVAGLGMLSMPAQAQICAGRSEHKSSGIPPRLLMVVDQSGSMNSIKIGGNSLWSLAETVISHVADWSYLGPGCTPGAKRRNCDRFHVGVHFWSDTKRKEISPGEDVQGQDIKREFGRAGGGTQFDLAAELVLEDAVLRNPDSPGVAVFVTDGYPDHAFTTREGVRKFCEARLRDPAPVATYALGFGGATNEDVNSLVAAAGGTGSCCIEKDGNKCDPLNPDEQVDPCWLAQFEVANRDRLVAEFESMLSNQEQSRFDEVYNHLNTSEGATRRSLSHKIDFVYDFAMWLRWHKIGTPQQVAWLEKMNDTLQPYIRHSYTQSEDATRRVKGTLSEEVATNRYKYFKSVLDDSADMYNGLTCTGGIEARTGPEFKKYMLALLDDLQCTFPLALLDGMISAPQDTGYTSVDMYFPALGTDMSVPHIDDASGQMQLASRLKNFGLNGNYSGEGWFFSNVGRTSVSLTDGLCALINDDQVVDRVYTRVCKPCPNEGEACTVTCAPGDENCFDGYKVGRCSVGVYACTDTGEQICVQTSNPMPEVCNGVDDDCDGSVDDMRENREQWSGVQWDLSARFGGEYEGFYCGFENSCGCPNGPDAWAGDASDADEFATYMTFHSENHTCMCGAGQEIAQSPAPRGQESSGAPDIDSSEDPQAGGCSAAGGKRAPGELLLLGLLVMVWRRRRRSRGSYAINS